MTKKIKQEQGRSMVEMLGVLAIIGVLSVAGIAGYKSAITSHRANETIDRLLKRAVVIAGQVGLGQQADISGFNEEDGTYKILSSINTDTAGQFGMTVKDVPEEVCQKIKDAWTLPTINPSPCETGTADMTFAFNNDLSEAGNGGNGGNTPADDPCQGYDSQCCNEGDISSTGSCNYAGTADGQCHFGHCNPTYCPSGGGNYQHITEAECSNCFNAVYGSGGCWGCPTRDQAIQFPSQDTCERCGGAYNMGYCRVTPCPDGTIMAGNACVTCPSESTTYVSLTGGQCAQCPNSVYYSGSGGYCFHCPAEGESVGMPDSATCSACGGTYSLGNCSY